MVAGRGGDRVMDRCMQDREAPRGMDGGRVRPGGPEDAEQRPIPLDDRSGAGVAPAADAGGRPWYAHRQHGRASGAGAQNVSACNLCHLELLSLSRGLCRPCLNRSAGYIEHDRSGDITRELDRELALADRRGIVLVERTRSRTEAGDPMDVADNALLALGRAETGPSALLPDSAARFPDGGHYR